MSQKRILISRPDRIGDVVLSTGIPREIKNKYPNSFVAVLVRSYTKDIFLNNPFVDEIIVDDFTKEEKWNGFGERLKEIKKHKFTDALMLLPNERICYMLFLAGIKNRVGVGHKLYQMLTFTKYVTRNKYNPLRHEADYCMDLVRQLGVKTDNLDSVIYLSDAEKAVVQRRREDFLGDKKYLIGIHLGSGKSAPNWSEETYIRLIERLGENSEFKIAVTENEMPFKLRHHPELIFPNINKPLRESILNFATLDCLVSASTGPMHIASGLLVNTVSLFCPLTACSPKLWGPKGNKSSIVLPHHSYCDKNCEDKPHSCKFGNEEGIEISRVIENIESIIQFNK